MPGRGDQRARPMRAYVEPLKSGRYRGVIRPPGVKSISASWDYEYEARDFVERTLARLAAVDDLAAAVTGTAPSRESATAAATGSPRPSSAPTLDARAADWLKRKRASVGEATLAYYARGVDSITASGFAHKPLDEIRRDDDVETWLGALDDDGVSPYTTLRALKTLRSIYRDAVINGKTPSDVTLGIPLPTLEIRADRIVDRDEETRILAVADPQESLWMLLALDAGLRWGEAAGLPLSAVDLDRGFVTVRQVIERGTGSIRRYPKSKHPRVVPLTERLIAALRPFVAAARLRAGGDGAALIFVTKHGWQWRYELWRDRWTSIRAAAGLADPQPRYHDLRHTFGTRCAHAGVPRKTIADWMGHSDERITGRYIHATDDGVQQKLLRAALEPVAS